VNIIAAIKDPNIFRSFLANQAGSIASWGNWLCALRVLYGLPTPTRYAELIKSCTGRDASGLPIEGFRTALFLVGRRCGKSRSASMCGAYEAALGQHEKHLARGEQGVVAVVAPTRLQARVCKNYLSAIFQVPVLKAEVVDQDRTGFTLRSGIRLEVMTGNFKTIRGFTLVAAIIDEICFFGVDEEAKIKSDTELVRAVSPSLATSHGKLIAISSPYMKKGWAFRMWKRHLGREGGKTLIWNCASAIMNPTLDAGIVAEAMEEDAVAARSEYGGLWREDICEFLPRSLVEQLVTKNRLELLPRREIQYSAFVDISGGRADDACLAIGHRLDRKTVLDKLVRVRPPFNPNQVIGRLAEECRQYGITHVVGDNFGAEFTASAFQASGVRYSKCELVKSQLYLEFIAIACSNEVELLDDPAAVDQICGLERKTHAGGRDSVDHGQGAHDDLANVIAGLCTIVGKKKRIIGAY
jgi:hypothetical protein